MFGSQVGQSGLEGVLSAGRGNPQINSAQTNRTQEMIRTDCNNIEGWARVGLQLFVWENDTIINKQLYKNCLFRVLRTTNLLLPHLLLSLPEALQSYFQRTGEKNG